MGLFVALVALKLSERLPLKGAVSVIRHSGRGADP